MDINQIKESVLDFIERGNSDDFPEMALKIYKFQFNENEDYKNSVSLKVKHHKMFQIGKKYLLFQSMHLNMLRLALYHLRILNIHI